MLEMQYMSQVVDTASSCIEIRTYSHRYKWLMNILRPTSCRKHTIE